MLNRHVYTDQNQFTNITNMRSKRNITRFAYESTGFKGWRVSITRFGETFTQYFSDKKCGGAKKSLVKAEACREWLDQRLNEAETVTKVKRGAKGHVIGVSCITPPPTRSGKVNVVWLASWPEDGKRNVVKFPAKKHGARQARQLAIDARRDAEERLGLNRNVSIRKSESDNIRKELEAFISKP